MKTCTNCGQGNKDEAKFCGACGAKLDVPPPAVEQKPAGTVCPVCGSKNRPGVRFCGYCGANLSQAAEAAAVAPPPTGAIPAPAEEPGEPSTSLAAGQPGPVEVEETAPDVPALPGNDALADASPETVPELIPAVAQAPSERQPVGTCSHCGTIIRYCPCCGQPLFEGESIPA